MLAFYVIAIAFLHAVCVEGFGVTQSDAAVVTATESKRHVSIGKGFVVKYDAGLGVGGYNGWSFSREEVFAHLDILSLTYLSKTLHLQLTLWKLRLLQHPAPVSAVDARLPHKVGLGYYLSLLPATEISISVEPVGYMSVHVYTFTRAGNIPARCDDLSGTIRFVFYAQPLTISVQAGCRLVYSMYIESCAIGGVGLTVIGTLVPHHRSHGVPATVQIRCNIHLFAVPVSDITASWAYGCNPSIDKELVAVVARYPYSHGTRRSSDIDVFAELIHSVTLGTAPRHCYPAFLDVLRQS